MKIKIKNDLFNIAERMKRDFPDYEIVFNTENQRFQIEKGEGTVLVIPYENLDERTLDRLYFTRAENVEEVLAEVEKHNEELAKKELKAGQDKLEDDYSRITRLMNI